MAELESECGRIELKSTALNTRVVGSNPTSIPVGVPNVIHLLNLGTATAQWMTQPSPLNNLQWAGLGANKQYFNKHPFNKKHVFVAFNQHKRIRNVFAHQMMN